ncbi:MAG: hypothetical protein GY940_17890, partial [bacterium]|nr:hypothetical protein [bacterium]
KIKKVQPHGPYLLAGWSLGGVIAFEMARQLEQLNREVRFLGLLDSRPPLDSIAEENRDRMASFTTETELEVVMEYLPDIEIREQLETVTDVSEFWPLLIDYLERTPDIFAKVKEIIATPEDRMRPDFSQLGIRELVALMNLDRTFIDAYVRYQPESRVEALAHYFEAGESDKTFKTGWQTFLKRSLKDYEVSGNHYSIFVAPGVEVLAELVNGQLSKFR